MCVNNLSKVALDSVAAGIEPRSPVASQRPNHYATEPHVKYVLLLIVHKIFYAVDVKYGPWQATCAHTCFCHQTVKLVT